MNGYSQGNIYKRKVNCLLKLILKTLLYYLVVFKSYILERYTQHVRDNPDLYNSLMELDGKVLGCWCEPSPCHGHALVQLINEVKNKKN